MATPDPEPQCPVIGLPRAHGGVVLAGVLREQPEAFVVEEQLGFAASGDGEHVLLHVEKRALTTLDVQAAIARLVQVPVRDVGYAGLKDKWACTRQWFSVAVPAANEPDWQQLETALPTAGEQPGCLKVLAASRHNRKLRRGAHRANRFRLRVRLDDTIAAQQRDVLAARCEAVSESGFPNYFTEQRFGFHGRNLTQAQALFGGRRLSRVQRSMALSAARALLFNEVLAQRVAQGSWCTVLPGDVMMLAGSQSVFVAEPGDEAFAALQQRLQAGDVHISGPLPGNGGVCASGAAGQVEAAALAGHAEIQRGLQEAGLDSQRRALRALVHELQWQAEADLLELQFELGRGSYATALLRELVDYHDVSGAAWR